AQGAPSAVRALEADRPLGVLAGVGAVSAGGCLHSLADGAPSVGDAADGGESVHAGVRACVRVEGPDPGASGALRRAGRALRDDPAGAAGGAEAGALGQVDARAR